MLTTNRIFYCKFMLVAKVCIMVVIIERVRCFGILFLTRLCVVGFCKWGCYMMLMLIMPSYVMCSILTSHIICNGC
jgi:hypothetical protein